MAEGWDRADLVADGFTHVYVELEWWDGPRAGIVDIDGAPHYFERDEDESWERLDEYFVWPADAGVVALEREAWAIFVRWNQRYETAPTSAGPHPGEGRVNARYDELAALLAPYHRAPAAARRLLAEWRFDDGQRYRMDGTDSWVRWSAAE